MTKISFLCSKIQQWLWLQHWSSKQKHSRRTDRSNSNKLFAVWPRRFVGKTCNNSTGLRRPTKTSYPWTRTHQDKLQTVPETNKPESKRETIEIDTSMVGGSSKLRDDPMSEETKDHEPSALRLNLPKDFSGKREDLKKFLQQVNLYMDVNAKIYKDNMMKIACVLSFIDEGDASSWKEHSKNIHQRSNIDFPPWLWHLDKFWKKIKRGLPALWHTRRRPQRNQNPVNGEQLNQRSQCKILNATNQIRAQQNVPSYHRLLLRDPQSPLQKRLLGLENPPTTLQEWYDKSTKYDNLFRKIQQIAGWGRQERGTKEESLDVYQERPQCSGCGPFIPQEKRWSNEERTVFWMWENLDIQIETALIERRWPGLTLQFLPHQRKWMWRNSMPTFEA